MAQSWLWMLLFAGLLAIAVLSVVAIRLLWQLRRQRRRQRQLLAELELAANSQRQRLNDSVQVIAQALLADQVGLAEASIRISVLLDALSVGDAIREEFAAFWQMAERVDHIPTHDDWIRLERSERRRYRSEIDALERQFDSFIRDAATRLQGRRFGLPE